MLRLSLYLTPSAASTQNYVPLHVFASSHRIPLVYRFSSSPCRLSAQSRFRLPLLQRAIPESSRTSASAAINHGEEDNGSILELHKLLVLLPNRIRDKVNAHPEFHQLVEIVLDLGRKPLARFPSGDFVLSDELITLEDLNYATSQVGEFMADNRAGISRTLHRISAIRNRKGEIVGLTCRVGRAVSGSANLLRDLIEDGSSLLLIGPPGVGKTTVIREVARMLADDFKKRVMIVDTSNEIGGDGDVPHAGIGSARRMQVPNPDMQHKVMIEAVENHMPQVIVIDEIGTRLEAIAASTIAQRGIQLVATAHGVTIENLTMNPSLEMLVGGIQSVTLGDEEAGRRGGQKSVLERKGPATFSCGIEIISKTEMRIHHSLEATVDFLLAGKLPKFEIRRLNDLDSTEENATPEYKSSNDAPVDMALETIEDLMENDEIGIKESPSTNVNQVDLMGKATVRIYPYGISGMSILQAIKKLGLDQVIQLTDNIGEADAFLGLHSKLKKNLRIQAAIKSQCIPIYVIKASSWPQITKILRVIVADCHSKDDARGSLEEVEALEEARVAVEELVIPKGQAVDLLPRPAHIIRAQAAFLRGYKLLYEKVGQEPIIHLRILPPQTETNMPFSIDLNDDDNDGDDGNDDNGSIFNGVAQLPFLPT